MLCLFLKQRRGFYASALKDAAYGGSLAVSVNSEMQALGLETVTEHFLNYLCSELKHLNSDFSGIKFKYPATKCLE